MCEWVRSACGVVGAARSQTRGGGPRAGRAAGQRIPVVTDLLPPRPLFSAFLLASLVLAVTPGPGVLYVVTRSLVHGHRGGLVSAAGAAAPALARRGVRRTGRLVGGSVFVGLGVFAALAGARHAK